MRYVLLVFVCACSDGSGFAGRYETTSVTRGACGTEAAAPIAAQEAYFRLDDVDALVGYYACADLERCEDLYDVSRSFGKAKDSGWAGYVSSAIPVNGCTLTHRIRRLRSTETGVEITTEVYRMTDDTLPGADCDQAVASERGTSMPCIETSTLAAEDR